MTTQSIIDVNPSVPEELVTLARAINAEAIYIGETINDHECANRLRSLVRDIATICDQIQRPDLVNQITSLEEDWPTRNFDEDGNDLDDTENDEAENL